MGKFSVVNKLHKETIKISEGSGGAFFQVDSILPGEEYVIKVDSQATYREIVLTLDPGTLQATFSSDDWQDWKGVRITGIDTTTSKLLYDKVKRTSRNISGMTTDANLSNLGESLLKFIGKGRKRPSLSFQPAGASQPQPATAPQPALTSESQPAIAPQPVEVPNYGKHSNWWKRPRQTEKYRRTELKIKPKFLQSEANS